MVFFSEGGKGLRLESCGCITVGEFRAESLMFNGAYQTGNTGA